MPRLSAKRRKNPVRVCLGGTKQSGCQGTLSHERLPTCLAPAPFLQAPHRARSCGHKPLLRSLHGLTGPRGTRQEPSQPGG